MLRQGLFKAKTAQKAGLTLSTSQTLLAKQTAMCKSSLALTNLVPFSFPHFTVPWKPIPSLHRR